MSTVLAQTYPAHTEAGKITAQIREEMQATLDNENSGLRAIAEKHGVPFEVAREVWFYEKALCPKCAGRKRDGDGHSCGPCNGSGVA